jgi:hypothetical protein
MPVSGPEVVAEMEPQFLVHPDASATYGERALKGVIENRKAAKRQVQIIG